MRVLFDVNCLLAIFDTNHSHHSHARLWWTGNLQSGWATCPITQNGLIRIMSQPTYPGVAPIVDIMNSLRDAMSDQSHVFWPDSVSISDEKLVEQSRILGPNTITDIYLLALAKKNSGRLVTFDRSVSITAVKGAKAENLVIL